MHNQIAPHGGALVNKLITGAERTFWLEKAQTLPSIVIDKRSLSDVEMIAVGAMSPLEGFMCREDYNSVVEHMRFETGLPWSLPIVLGVSRDEADDFDVESYITLKSEAGEIVAVLQLQEKYIVNKEREAALVYKTTSLEHPGVKYLMEKRGEVLLGGELKVLNLPLHSSYPNYRLTPHETRSEFDKNGWLTIAAYQSHNPIHRAHEYITKCALEICDGLIVHPTVGETLEDDVPPEIRVKCLETVLENYYPETNNMMTIVPAGLRFAGPREAVFHAIVQKNYGCTHIIIGDDYAGVKGFYGRQDAQKIFKEFGKYELGIVPLFFENIFYCKSCQHLASIKTCPHDVHEHIKFRGTEIREMFKDGKVPGLEITRQEVADILKKYYKK